MNKDYIEKENLLFEKHTRTKTAFEVEKIRKGLKSVMA